VDARPLVALRQSTVSLAPASLLALQRTSGNKAVGTLIQRQPAETTRADARKLPAVSATLIMEDPIGVMPLIGYSQGKRSDMHVTIPSTTLDSVLMRYMMQGIQMKQVKISTTRFEIELDDVYIAGFERSESDGEAVVHMTLGFAAQRFK
jgi:hypothetical protein